MLFVRCKCVIQDMSTRICENNFTVNCLSDNNMREHRFSYDSRIVCFHVGKEVVYKQTDSFFVYIHNFISSSPARPLCGRTLRRLVPLCRTASWRVGPYLFYFENKERSSITSFLSWFLSEVSSNISVPEKKSLLKCPEIFQFGISTLRGFFIFFKSFLAAWRKRYF